ncbi:hypothetical protein STCU_10570 [Strigomonas culicis]|uniref:Uncharacterized protein n=1 Tax=Strigomonas culicis TaxID=28005 RepID=S9TMF9_9TRYP|nr:hypothetical protein STCU_10570 [Strigomonas culicis]|eukprot:EPY17518.1 hypothetical protein STCU_10570 [Strigomonas culicis]
MTVNGRSVEVYGPCSGEVLLRFVPLGATLPVVVHCPPESTDTFLAHMDCYSFPEQDSAAARPPPYAAVASSTPPKIDLPTVRRCGLAIRDDLRNYDFSPESPLRAAAPHTGGPAVPVNGSNGTEPLPLPQRANPFALPPPRYPAIIEAL